MRRLFIIRKDLNLSPGKLAAMVGHCCEAYWTNLIKEHCSGFKEILDNGANGDYNVIMHIPQEIMDEYVHGIFTKTICEAKNLNQLRKVDSYIATINEELPNSKKLIQQIDYGWINDKCLTELTPENPDGTTTIGMWFRPLPDDIAHKLSKKYKLYGSFDAKRNCDVYKTLNEAKDAYNKCHQAIDANDQFIEWLFKAYDKTEKSS